MSDNKKVSEYRQKIDEWFAQHTDEMLEDLRQLLAVRSVKGPAEYGAPYGAGPRDALDLAKEMLSKRGFDVSVFEDIVITADLGPSPPLMGILAHLDTVDEGEGWDTDPFEMTIKGGKIYGRGATDNKGPSIAAMYAAYCARDINPALRNGLRLLFGSGEEGGCDDIASYLEKNDPPPNVFTPDADFPLVNFEKGRILPEFCASWEKDDRLPRIVSITGGKTTNVVPGRAEAVIEGLPIDVVMRFCGEYSGLTGADLFIRESGGQLIINAEGTSAHAANPYLGLNAQTALIEMLAAMPFADSIGFGYVRALNRLFPHGDYLGNAFGIAMSDEISGELTLNFGVLDCNETGLSGNFNSRTPECSDSVNMRDLVLKSFKREGFTVTDLSVGLSHHTPKESPFVQNLLRIYEEYTGNPGECLAVGGQTYVHEIPGGVAFGCEFPGLDNCIHGANEFIEFEQLILSAKMFTQAILDICG